MFATTAAKLAKQEKVCMNGLHGIIPHPLSHLSCTSLCQSCLSVGNSVIAMDSVSYLYFDGILADCSRLTAVECNNCEFGCFEEMGEEKDLIFYILHYIREFEEHIALIFYR